MQCPTLIQEIKNTLPHARPQGSYLYGSEATGEAHDGSDINIAWGRCVSNPSDSAQCNNWVFES